MDLHLSYTPDSAKHRALFSKHIEYKSLSAIMELWTFLYPLLRTLRIVFSRHTCCVGLGIRAIETSCLPPLHLHTGNTWRCSRIRHDRAMFAIHDKIVFLSSAISCQNRWLDCSLNIQGNPVCKPANSSYYNLLLFFIFKFALNF